MPISACVFQVLCGLLYLHQERRIIHRDIKPCNILLNKKGQIKIADFGVSGEMENSVDGKVSFVGTVTYMSVCGMEQQYGSSFSGLFQRDGIVGEEGSKELYFRLWP